MSMTRNELNSTPQCGGVRKSGPRRSRRRSAFYNARIMPRSVYKAAAAHARPERAGARHGTRRLHSTDARRSPRVGWTKSHQTPTASGAGPRSARAFDGRLRVKSHCVGAFRRRKITRITTSDGDPSRLSVVVSRRHRSSEWVGSRGVVRLTAPRNYSVRKARSSDAESARNATESLESPKARLSPGPAEVRFFALGV